MTGCCPRWSPATAASVEDLLVDELGYVSIDPKGAELLFQVLTEREERASVATASNHPSSEWGQTFSDPRLAAVLDRVLAHLHRIELVGESMRRRGSASKTAGTGEESGRDEPSRPTGPASADGTGEATSAGSA